ncbi:Hypothetical predicted protein, partial [Pelobates cultripes]
MSWLNKLYGSANSAFSANLRKSTLCKLDAKLVDLACNEMDPRNSGFLLWDKFMKKLTHHVSIQTKLRMVQVSFCSRDQGWSEVRMRHQNNVLLWHEAPTFYGPQSTDSNTAHYFPTDLLMDKALLSGRELPQ